MYLNGDVIKSMQTILLDNKTIFVTGAAGFIGSNLVLRLFKEMSEGTIVCAIASPILMPISCAT